MMKRLEFALLMLIALWPDSPGASELATVTFLPHWVPQAQFAGYFVALGKGIYTRAGLDVSILAGGPGVVPCDSLKTGRVDFASLWLTDGIQKRAQGAPLVALGQLEQKSALMLVAKKSSGIRTPADLNNRKISLWDSQFQLQPRALFRKFGLDVKTIPQSYSVNLFLRGGVDAASAMWYNEYHTIINCGVDPDELTTFFFFDYDLNFPEAGLYTSESTLARDARVCSSFVAASTEGWRYALAHDNEALDIVLAWMKRAHIPANRVHQRWMLARMRDIMIIDSSGAPDLVLRETDYTRVASALRESEMIKDMPPYQTFYRGSPAP